MMFNVDTNFQLSCLPCLNLLPRLLVFPGFQNNIDSFRLLVRFVLFSVLHWLTEGEPVSPSLCHRCCTVYKGDDSHSSQTRLVTRLPQVFTPLSTQQEGSPCPESRFTTLHINLSSSFHFVDGWGFVVVVFCLFVFFSTSTFPSWTWIRH